MAYRIVFDPETRAHFAFLKAAQRSLVLDSVDEQLTYNPAVETRNRKPMRANDFAGWELRIRDLRVYYVIEEEAQIVRIRAVGVKVRNRVYVGKKEFTL